MIVLEDVTLHCTAVTTDGEQSPGVGASPGGAPAASAPSANETTTMDGAAEVPGYFERIAAAVLHNVEVHVHRLHLHYDERLPAGAALFAPGPSQAPFEARASVDAVSVRAVDCRWRPSFV